MRNSSGRDIAQLKLPGDESGILRMDNPRYDAVMEAVDRFIADFQDKLKD